MFWPGHFESLKPHLSELGLKSIKCKHIGVTLHKLEVISSQNSTRLKTSQSLNARYRVYTLFLTVLARLSHTLV